jgi:hypothetical protein
LIDQHQLSERGAGSLLGLSRTGYRYQALPRRHQVARYLDQLGDEPPLPSVITGDNGTEFTRGAMFFWAKESKLKLSFK